MRALRVLVLGLSLALPAEAIFKFIRNFKKADSEGREELIASVVKKVETRHQQIIEAEDPKEAAREAIEEVQTKIEEHIPEDHKEEVEDVISHVEAVKEENKETIRSVAEELQQDQPDREAIQEHLCAAAETESAKSLVRRLKQSQKYLAENCAEDDAPRMCQWAKQGLAILRAQYKKCELLDIFGFPNISQSSFFRNVLDKC